MDLLRDANRALLGEGELDRVEEFFAEDYVAHLTDGGVIRGTEAVKRFVATLRRAFDGLQVYVEILVQGGDRVAWQRTIRGTHARAFQGFPASKKEVLWRDMLVSRVADGRIHEEWAVSDLAERLLRTR